jgi:two-component system response regulator FlrC
MIYTDLFEGMGFLVDAVPEGSGALNYLISQKPEVVVADDGTPGFSALDFLKQAADSDIGVPKTIILTPDPVVDYAVSLIQHGAMDYLIKPVDLRQLELSVKKSLAAAISPLPAEKEKTVQHKAVQIITKDHRMENLLKLAARVADSSASVLIQGESGTGKELLARFLHEKSARRHQPFIAVNCAALPENLLESELFGYKKGAFTGATRDRAGLFEAADGGTVFLDEIGDMPMGTQAALLRVLQKNEIKPLGASQVRYINIRIIAATNKDLAGMIQENRFRQDLYYRLSVLPIHLPPLRERREDIPLLVRHFLNVEGRKTNISEKKISPEAIHHLVAYTWPGNIRELENLIRYLMVTTQNEIIKPVDLPERILKINPDGVTENTALRNTDPQTNGTRYLRDICAMTWPDLEKAYVMALMEKFNWNITWAAKASGINRSTFASRMRKLDIHRGTGESPDSTSMG